MWVFFTVEKGDEPVAGLQAEDFEIYEDGEIVSTFESKQVIQNPEVAAVMYTMLLLDVSGSITESGSADSLVDAATLFTDRVGKTQKVGVYSFDGDKEIRAVVPFTEAQGAAVGGLESLRTYKAKDPSTNLHGAVIEGLKELQKQLAKEKKSLKDFKEEDWSIIEEVSMIRSQWPKEMSAFHRKKFQKIGYFWTQYRKNLGPGIPSQFKERLDQKFYERVASLANLSEVYVFSLDN